MHVRAHVLLGAGLAAGLLLAGCGDDEADGDVTAATAENGFVGALEGTDAYVAVVASEDAVEVYTCDGESGIAEQFLGDVDDPTEFALTNDAGGSAEVAYADGAYTGEITLADGSTHAFATEAAEGTAGLYHLGDDAPDGVSAGWVVLNDGTQRGAVGFGTGVQAAAANSIMLENVLVSSYVIGVPRSPGGPNVDVSVRRSRP